MIGKKKEELNESREKKLHVRMSEIKPAHRKTVGNTFKFIRGTGLVKRED